MVYTLETSIVIASYNRKDCLKICLSSLEDQTYGDFEIILVDDCSTDGSAEFAEGFSPKTRVIRNPKNIGYTGSQNIGIKNSKGIYIALLDSDTYVDKKWLEELIGTIKTDRSIGSCAPKTLASLGSDRINNMGHGLYYDFFPLHIGEDEKDSGQFDKLREVFGVCLGGALIRKEVFDVAGLLQDSHSNEFNWRLRSTGYRCVSVPSAVMYHQRLGSGKLNASFLLLWAYGIRWIIVYYSLGMLAAAIYYTLKRYIRAFLFYSSRTKLKDNLSLGKIILTVISAWLKVLLDSPRLIRQRIKMRVIQKIPNSEMKKWLRKE